MKIKKKKFDWHWKWIEKNDLVRLSGLTSSFIKQRTLPELIPDEMLKDNDRDVIRLHSFNPYHRVYVLKTNYEHWYFFSASASLICRQERKPSPEKKKKMRRISVGLGGGRVKQMIQGLKGQEHTKCAVVVNSSSGIALRPPCLFSLTVLSFPMKK